MNDKARLFYHIGEPYAAGLFEETPSVFARFARAQRRYWEALSPAPYNGELLYPSGQAVKTGAALVPNYSYTYAYNATEMEKKSPEGAALLAGMPPELPGVSHPHDVGGNMYTHSIPNFGRIAREGLDSYALRAAECPDKAFAAGIADLVTGLRDYHIRCVDMLRECGADESLIAALSRVPFQPARNIYDAIVCFNFIWYMDGCDNVGMLDTELDYFHRGEDVTDLLRTYFNNVDANGGWTGALGPEYSALTVMCLRAIAGLRRPSLELRLTEQVPDEVWEAAADAIISGCGQPSFYNESLYQSALSAAMPDIAREDLLRFCGGGCTESMLSGISNVGSLDAGINAAFVFREYMNAHLTEVDSFDEFYRGLMDKLKGVVSGVLAEINRARAARASLRPQPVRTLFIDDCIDRGLDFNNGGARWSWSVVNIAGMINVIDSLLAVRALVFDEKTYPAPEFLHLLNAHDEVLYGEFEQCPRYGVDDPEADAIAHDFSAELLGFFTDIKPFGGEAFLPSSIQFTTYADAGRYVGATPDGRRDGDCLCDSIGAVHNRDTAGPTALLNSAARLAQPLAAGTPIMNIRISRDHVSQALKPLVIGYFKNGGMQLQITCVSKQEIAEALENPEAHPNLIVRIGGYSEYFRNLTPELRRSVYERTEY